VSRIDDLRTYLIANIGPYITARSTVPVPLAALTADYIHVGEYKPPNGTACLWLVDGEEESEFLTLNTRKIALPVAVYAFTSGATETVLKEQARQYAEAALDCLATYPEYDGIEGREHFNSVEGNEGMKATKIDLQFAYEETV